MVPVRRPLKAALDAGRAPRVVLEATHASSLEWASLDDLRRHAAD